nr:hypothetical protein [Tanacetum cinerariifolium]
MIWAQVGDLSSHSKKYSSPALTQKVFANMRRVEKGFSRVDTPLFEGMIVAQQADEGAAKVYVDDVPIAGVADEGAANDNADVVLTAVDEPSIPSPPSTTQPPPPSQDVPSTSQVQPTPPPSLIVQPPSQQQQPQPLQDAKISMNLLHNLLDTWEDNCSMDANVDVTLKDVVDIAKEVVVDAEIEESDDEVEPAELQEVVEVVTTAKLITEVVTTATLTLTTAPSAARRRKGVVIRDPEETAIPYTIIHTETKSKDKGKGILVEEPKPLKKQVQIEQDEAFARELKAELNKIINWDDVIDQVQRKEKEDNVVMRYQAWKRKPQTEAQARKNIMIYLRNMAGFKTDYFKGMKYHDIRLIFEKYFNSNVAFLEKTKEQIDEEDNRALKRISESQEDKSAKKLKFDEEVAELKRHL